MNTLFYGSILIHLRARMQPSRTIDTVAIEQCNCRRLCLDSAHVTRSDLMLETEYALASLELAPA
jgi:hypothetical protein